MSFTCSILGKYKLSSGIMMQTFAQVKDKTLSIERTYRGGLIGSRLDD